MANGILIVDKPRDWTSQDVVSKLRGLFHERRAGHGGTLDPMATGVLPLFFGRATRAVEFFEHADKTYVAGLRLGLVTDTQDTTGNLLEEKPCNVSREELEAALSHFVGELQQIPPMYSAIKVGGQKLYDLARKGREVERQPRPVTIHELTLLGMEAEGIRLRVRCSKGTYIRTLCKDIGQALGCGGCMAQLRRVQAGEYTIKNSVPLQTLIESDDPGKYLLPVDSMFMAYPQVILTEKQEKCCRNGVAFTCNLAEGTYRVYGGNGEFLALSHMVEGKLTTIKSFWAV